MNMAVNVTHGRTAPEDLPMITTGTQTRAFHKKQEREKLSLNRGKSESHLLSAAGGMKGCKKLKALISCVS